MTKSATYTHTHMHNNVFGEELFLGSCAEKKDQIIAPTFSHEQLSQVPQQ